MSVFCCMSQSLPRCGQMFSVVHTKPIDKQHRAYISHICLDITLDFISMDLVEYWQFDVLVIVCV